MPAPDAVGAVAELAASQHGAFTVRQADFLGVTRRQLDNIEARGAIALVRSGVFVVAGSPPTWRRALTVATLAGGGAIASHRAALGLHGLGGLRLPPVEVTVENGRYPRDPEVHVHRAKAIDPIDIDYVDNIPCTTIARTLCDIGTVLREGKVESILDDAIRRGVSELWVVETWRRVDRPGPSGTAVLGRILAKPDRQGTLPDSWFERLVERMLAPLTVEPPVRQYPVVINGRIVANIDLAWPAIKLGVEPSGLQHASVRRWRIDGRRMNRVVGAAGWTLLSPTWEDALDPTEFIAEFAATYARLTAGRPA